MRVVVPAAEDGLALCQDAEGTRHAVEVALVAPIHAGDAVLVHAAVALARLEGAAA